MKKTIISLLILVISITTNSANAKSKAQTPLTLEQRINLIKISKLDDETKLYEIAKLKLDKDTYRVYRTAERIIRANKLSEYSWVFELKYDDETYTTNALTSEGNLISLSFGTLQTFGDDVSQLAFIIGHEMAHEQLKHIANKQRKTSAIQEELNEAIKKYNENSEKKVVQYNFFQQLFMANTEYYTTEELKKDEARIKELKEELAQETMTISRQQEYEADSLGLQYALKAGFNPNAAQKAFEFISKYNSNQKSDPNSTHPRTDERIWNIQNKLKESNLQQLRLEGKNNIKNSKPLSFTDTNRLKNRQVSRRFLVIDSKYSTLKEKNDQFKELFGK